MVAEGDGETVLVVVKEAVGVTVFVSVVVVPSGLGVTVEVTVLSGVLVIVTVLLNDPSSDLVSVTVTDLLTLSLGEAVGETEGVSVDAGEIVLLVVTVTVPVTVPLGERL